MAAFGNCMDKNVHANYGNSEAKTKACGQANDVPILDPLQNMCVMTIEALQVHAEPLKSYQLQ